jgi:hypothetical protein
MNPDSRSTDATLMLLALELLMHGTVSSCSCIGERLIRGITTAVWWMGSMLAGLCCWGLFEHVACCHCPAGD